MKTFSQIIDERKEKIRLQNEADIKSEFSVKERAGFLWLTHNGIAFMKINGNANASDVARMLNTARDCAVEFERI